VGELTGVLLVGGAARRLGRARADALTTCAWKALGEVCDERIAIGRAADGVRQHSELGGIVAALQVARTEVCVVLAVDGSPVSAASLQALADACTDVALSSSGTLPGAYRKSALPTLESCLASGRLEVRDGIGALDVVRLSLPEEIAA
jgi:molybdopterin-guanine dinucleotide biosynthesis protein A